MCTMLVTMMSLQVITGPPAHAASCSWPKKGYQVCTGIRHEVLISNIYTQPKWKVCGAGNEKVIGIQLDQAWTYPGTTLKIQHCYAYNNGAGTFCSTFFKRTIPDS